MLVLWGWVAMEGGVHTATVAVALSAGPPHPLLTRTQ
jgi:hypothetical protein